MLVGDYSKRSISNYIREIRFIGEYYPDKPVSALSKDDITNYMLYLKQTLGVGRDKCRMTASALQWLFKHVLEQPYDLPSKLYPKKTFSLPEIMSADQVRQLFDAPLSIKQRALCEVFYSTGVRLEECTQLKVADIDSKSMCIHLRQGKGRKDRKLIQSIAKAQLLIIDDFGIHKLDDMQRLDLMEIIEDRHGIKSTVIASQLPVAAWYEIIAEPTLSDAILDRITAKSIRLDLKGESLRK